MAGAGFGWGAFGQGPFGEARWGYDALWRSLPAIHRQVDGDNDDLLQKFMLGIADATNLQRRQARDFPDQRDARLARTRFNVVLGFTIVPAGTEFVSSSDSEDGRAYIVLVVDNVVSLDPKLTYEAGIEHVFPGWALEADNRTYIVRAVRKSTMEIEVYGDETDGEPTGTLSLRPPSMISRLGFDYNVEVDGNEPEDFQRSTVYDAVKWFNLKGTEKGIQLRARVAGFEVEVVKLYRIGGDFTDWIGSDHVLEIPDGSGQFYSDYGPRLFRFDDIAADMLPLDGHCNVTVQPAWTYTAIDAGTVDNGDGTWSLEGTFDTDNPVVGGRWLLTSGNDPAETYYVENPGDLVGEASGPIVVVADSKPDTTAVYALTYECPETISCDWCKSYKVRLVLEVVDPQLIGNEVALEGAFDRLLRKITELIPAHVELVQIVFTESATAEIDISVVSTSQSLVFPLYDDNPADDTPTDTPVIVAH